MIDNPLKPATAVLPNNAAPPSNPYEALGYVEEKPTRSSAPIKSPKPDPYVALGYVEEKPVDAEADPYVALGYTEEKTIAPAPTLTPAPPQEGFREKYLGWLGYAPEQALSIVAHAVDFFPSMIRGTKETSRFFWVAAIGEEKTAAIEQLSYRNPVVGQLLKKGEALLDASGNFKNEADALLMQEALKQGGLPGVAAAALTNTILDTLMTLKTLKALGIGYGTQAGVKSTLGNAAIRATIMAVSAEGLSPKDKIASWALGFAYQATPALSGTIGKWFKSDWIAKVADVTSNVAITATFGKVVDEGYARAEAEGKPEMAGFYVMLNAIQKYGSDVVFGLMTKAFRASRNPAIVREIEKVAKAANVKVPTAFEIDTAAGKPPKVVLQPKPLVPPPPPTSEKAAIAAVPIRDTVQKEGVAGALPSRVEPATKPAAPAMPDQLIEDINRSIQIDSALKGLGYKPVTPTVTGVEIIAAKGHKAFMKALESGDTLKAQSIADITNKANDWLRQAQKRGEQLGAPVTGDLIVPSKPAAPTTQIIYKGISKEGLQAAIESGSLEPQYERFPTEDPSHYFTTDLKAGKEYSKTTATGGESGELLRIKSSTAKFEPDPEGEKGSIRTFEKIPIQDAEVFRDGKWVALIKPAAPAKALPSEPTSAPEYSIAQDKVDGRIVRKGIPNTDSIDASVPNNKSLDGIREVPMSDFELTGKHYSVEGDKRIGELADQIKASGEISPLIVVLEKNGPYVLEGATRADALFRLGAKSFPAKVVVNLDSPPEGYKGEIQGKPAAPEGKQELMTPEKVTLLQNIEKENDVKLGQRDVVQLRALETLLGKGTYKDPIHDKLKDSQAVYNRISDVVDAKEAVASRKSVPQWQIEDYGIKLPKGYVGDGDNYVFKPAPPPQAKTEATQTKEQTKFAIDKPTEDHFVAWLDKTIPDIDRQSVESGMRNYLAKHSDVITKQGWGWPTVRSVAEREGFIKPAITETQAKTKAKGAKGKKVKTLTLKEQRREFQQATAEMKARKKAALGEMEDSDPIVQSVLEDGGITPSKYLVGTGIVQAGPRKGYRTLRPAEQEEYQGIDEIFQHKKGEKGGQSLDEAATKLGITAEELKLKLSDAALEYKQIYEGKRGEPTGKDLEAEAKFRTEEDARWDAIDKRLQKTGEELSSDNPSLSVGAEFTREGEVYRVVAEGDTGLIVEDGKQLFIPYETPAAKPERFYIDKGTLKKVETPVAESKGELGLGKQDLTLTGEKVVDTERIQKEKDSAIAKQAKLEEQAQDMFAKPPPEPPQGAAPTRADFNTPFDAPPDKDAMKPKVKGEPGFARVPSGIPGLRDAINYVFRQHGGVDERVVPIIEKWENGRQIIALKARTMSDEVLEIKQALRKSSLTKPERRQYSADLTKVMEQRMTIEELSGKYANVLDSPAGEKTLDFLKTLSDYREDFVKNIVPAMNRIGMSDEAATIEANKMMYIPYEYMRWIDPFYKPNAADKQRAIDMVKSEYANDVIALRERINAYDEYDTILDFLQTGDISKLPGLSPEKQVATQTLRNDYLGMLPFMRGIEMDTATGMIEFEANMDALQSSAREYVDSLLGKHKTSSTGNPFDMHHLIKRKLPEVFQILYGKIEDPERVMGSMVRIQQNLLNTTRFMDEIMALNSDPDGRPIYASMASPEHGLTVKLTGKQFGALDGKFVSKELARILRNDIVQTQQTSDTMVGKVATEIADIYRLAVKSGRTSAIFTARLVQRNILTNLMYPCLSGDRFRPTYAKHELEGLRLTKEIYQFMAGRVSAGSERDQQIKSVLKELGDNDIFVISQSGISADIDAFAREHGYTLPADVPAKWKTWYESKLDNARSYYSLCDFGYKYAMWKTSLDRFGGDKAKAREHVHRFGQYPHKLGRGLKAWSKLPFADFPTFMFDATRIHGGATVDFFKNLATLGRGGDWRQIVGYLMGTAIAAAAALPTAKYTSRAISKGLKIIKSVIGEEADTEFQELTPEQEGALYELVPEYDRNNPSYMWKEVAKDGSVTIHRIPTRGFSSPFPLMEILSGVINRNAKQAGGFGNMLKDPGVMAKIPLEVMEEYASNLLRTGMIPKAMSKTLFGRELGVVGASKYKSPEGGVAGLWASEDPRRLSKIGEFLFENSLEMFPPLFASQAVQYNFKRIMKEASKTKEGFGDPMTQKTMTDIAINSVAPLRLYTLNAESARRTILQNLRPFIDEIRKAKTTKEPDTVLIQHHYATLLDLTAKVKKSFVDTGVIKESAFYQILEDSGMSEDEYLSIYIGRMPPNFQKQQRITAAENFAILQGGPRQYSLNAFNKKFDTLKTMKDTSGDKFTEKTIYSLLENSDATGKKAHWKDMNPTERRAAINYLDDIIARPPTKSIVPTTHGITPAERIIEEIRNQGGEKAKSQFEMRNQAARGNLEPLDKALYERKITSDQHTEMLMDKRPSLDRELESLEVNDALRVWNAANPAERKQIKLTLRYKIVYADNITEKRKMELLKIVNTP